MSIKVNDKPDEQPTGAAIRKLGFGSSLGLIGATRGSEYTNSIAKTMQEVYANLPTPPKVNVFDREQMSNLAYSCIVVSMPNSNGEVCYHISLLEATGMDPLKASDIVSEATRAMREPNAGARIYTPSDAINGRLNNIILNDLSVQYPGAEFISTDGLVVHAASLEISDLGMRVAAIAFNATHTEAMLSSGELADLNITDAMADSNGSKRNGIKLEYNTYCTTVPNVIGSATRQDFKVDLVEVSQEHAFELNSDSRNRLVSVAGYIDAIREDLPVAAQMGVQPATITRLHPNIVMTNNDTVSPTQGFMLLGVASATVMSRPELWIQSLASIDNKSPNTPGGLNILTNIENGQNGVPLDFSAKSVTTEEHYAALKQMYSLSPIVSYDIEVFGPQAYYSSLLAAAASPSSDSTRLDALDEILEVCNQLTNGHFPSNFSTAEIFATEGLVIPLGYWMDKTGERDIRDIDMAFIANQTGDVNLVNKWGMTSLPRSVTGLDPFLTRVEIINQLIPDAVINGKAVRITFTQRFISELTSAIERAGLIARYETSVVINEQYNTAQFTDYLAAAGLSQATGFAQQGGANHAGLYTNYSTMGQFRY